MSIDITDTDFRRLFQDFLGIEELKGDIRYYRSTQIHKLESIEKSIAELRKNLMATFQEIMQAIEKNGTLSGEILSAISIEQEEVKEAIQDAINGVATPDQLQQALVTLSSTTESLGKAKDAITQLIPSVPSPENPTDPGQPLPTPEPVPASPDDVVVASAPGVGLEGSTAIDLA